MDAQEQVNKAISALTSFEVSDDQRNERSAMTLLALLGLQSGDSWDKSTNPLLGTRAIMDRIRDEYKVEYKPNTRETIRRFTLHQFVIAGICEENADQPVPSTPLIGTIALHLTLCTYSKHSARQNLTHW